MHSRWFYFFTAGISVLFSCNKQSIKSKAKDYPASHQTVQKNIPSKNNIPVIDKIAEDGFYDSLTSITLPFLPSSQQSHIVIICKMPALPYTTTAEKNLVYIKRQNYLISADSAFIIKQLKGLRPLIVNPDGGTSFGDFDCLLDSANCLNTEEYGKIGIICALRIDSNYMCHIVLTRKDWYYNDRGILALITPHGKILDWMFSDGELTEGNPHGNIIRMLTINLGNAVKIEEYSVGDNSEHYKFDATFSVRDIKFILKKRRIHMLSP